MDPRSAEAIKHHYDVERELANRIRDGDPDARAGLYSEVYDEMYSRVPDHPMLTSVLSEEERASYVSRQMGFVGPYLHPGVRFVEIGAGTCDLSFEAAKTAGSVVAIEVSETISDVDETPANFELVITDGITIPLDDNSVDVAYSNQLMEHLHPDDAIAQLAEVRRILRPGGFYLCVTPSRLTGPHDISQGFTKIATGFHLHEYTITELDRLCRSVGFVSVGVHLGARGRYLPRTPVAPFRWLEVLTEKLPDRVQSKVTGTIPMQMLLNVRIAART